MRPVSRLSARRRRGGRFVDTFALHNQTHTLDGAHIQYSAEVECLQVECCYRSRQSAVATTNAKMAAMTAKSAAIGAAAKTAVTGAFVRASAPLSTSAPTLAPSERRPKMAEVEGAASLAKMKKGPGYRSSFSGNVATVFGAGGMVGRSVMNRFGRNGTQIIVPYRGDFYFLQRLKVVGDLGQVLFTPFDLRDEESIRYLTLFNTCILRFLK